MKKPGLKAELFAEKLFGLLSQIKSTDLVKTATVGFGKP